MRLIYENYHKPTQGRFKDSFVLDNANSRLYVYDSQGSYALVDQTGKVAAQLTISGNQLSISGGNTVTLPISSGGGAVASVNGRTGVITLTKSDVGLANASNTADVDKPISTATQAALNTKLTATSLKTVNGNVLTGTGDIVIGAGNTTVPDASTTVKGIVQLAGDLGGTAAAPTVTKTYTKSDVGLANVDNTSDVNKPISLATSTALTGKESTVTAGTTSQYYRGDKTFQTLDKTAVGLTNVDNTADTTKPVSSVQQTALNAKQATLISGTNIKTIGGTSVLGSGDITVATGTASNASRSVVRANPYKYVIEDFNSYNGRWGLNANGTVAFTNGVMTITTVANDETQARRIFWSDILSGYDTITLDVNLNGFTYNKYGDSPLFVLQDQDGWKGINLLNFTTNGSSAWQTISLPLSYFNSNHNTTTSTAGTGTALNPATAILNVMHFRFYENSVKTLQVRNIVLTDSTKTLVEDFTQPDFLNTNKLGNALWRFQGIDLMKNTKDNMGNQLSDTDIARVIAAVLRFNPSHVSVATPYDNQAAFTADPAQSDGSVYAKRWATAARKAGLKVFWRQTPIQWQGGSNGYSVAKNNTRGIGTAAGIKAGTETGTYLKQIYDYIIANPTQYAPGDLISPIPEPENGVINGVTGTTNPQFSSAAVFRKWLRDAVTVVNMALEKIGLKGQIGVGFYGLSDFIIKGNTDNPKGFLDDRTWDAMTVLGMDTYPAPVSGVAGVFSGIEALYGTYRPLAVTEWGTINESTDATRKAASDTFYATLKSKSYLYGFAYWTVANTLTYGNSNEDLLDSTTLAPIGPYQNLIDLFTSGSATPGTYISKAIAANVSTPVDATVATKGIIQLAGDLAGTAAAPTVPGLSSKQALSSLPHILVASSTASAKQKALADYVATGTNDHTTIQTAINAVTTNGGVVELGAGTFNVTASISWAAHNVHLIGQGIDITIIKNTSAAADFDIIKIGNRQTDGVMRNSNSVEKMTITHAGGTSTKSCIWVDGGGRGSLISEVRTNESGIALRFTDLDRYLIEKVDTNNPRTVGIQYEVGAEGTFGKVALRDSSMNLSDASSIGFRATSLTGTNPYDALEFSNNLFFSTNGVTGTIGAQFLLAAIDTVFIGGQFESPLLAHVDINTTSDCRIKFIGVSFIQNSGTATANAIRLNGANHAISIDTCIFQKLTTVFNGVTGYSSFDFTGWTKNNGNIGSIFTGQFGLRHGTDTAFAGNGALYLGTDNERYENAFLNQLRINRGSAAAGKVWTATDTSGNGDWQALSSGTTDTSRIHNLTTDTTRTANFTAIKNTKVIVDTAAGALTATVPSTATLGDLLFIQRSDNNTRNDLTLAGPINGVTAATLPIRTALQGKLLQWDGTYWQVIAGDLNLAALEARFYSVLNVRSFGAKGDGVTDDTAPIKAALAAAAAAGGGIVFVPIGNYMVSDNLLVLSNVIFEGAGFGSRIFLAANTTLTNAAIVLAKDISGATRVSNFVVRNLQLDGNKANQSGTPVQLYGFYCEADGGIVENCWVHDNKGYGIDPHGTNGNDDWTKRLIIRDNFSYNNGTLANTDYDGITLDNIRYGTVSGNVSYNNARNGINMTTYGIGLSVVGNSVFGNQLDGIVMQNSSTGSAIVANEVFNNGNNGIIISNVNYASIGSNMIYGNGASGILLYRSSYNTISGNDLVNNSQSGNAAYADIYLNDDGTTYNLYNSVTGNTMSATGTNKAKYGIEEKSAASDYNVYTGNVMVGHTVAKQNLKGVNRTEYFDKNLGDTLTDGANIATGFTTGTKIATAAGQKLGFFGVTPVAQQGATAELGTLLSTLGFRASGTAFPISTSGFVSLSGGFKQGGISRTTDFTLSANNTPYQYASAANNTITATLPTAVGNNGMRFFLIKTDATANAVKFATQNSETINGNTTGVSLTVQYDVQTVISDGTNWYYADKPSTTGGGGTTYTAGTGLTLTGSQFALTTPVSIANGGTGSATQNFVDITSTAQTLADGKNISLGTTTGTQIGTASNQRVGFFGGTPAIQQTATTDLGAVLSNLGLRVAGFGYPISTSGNVSLNGGSYQSGSGSYTGSASLTTSSKPYAFVSAASAAVTVTLPTTTTANLLFTIKKTDSSTNAVTVKAGTSGTIDAANTFPLSTQYKTVTVMSTSTADVWWVVGAY